MTNPYQSEPPAPISFSGGRTSGYMLRQILDAYGGRLPPGVIACFANTGKEMPQTLDFVRACTEHWAVPIVWLEYAHDGEKQRKFRIVDHRTASRRGEPYEVLLRQRRYLPNPVTRFCTTQLKIRVMRDYARSLGWEHWTNAVGLRFDEAHRVGRIKNQKRDAWRPSPRCTTPGLPGRTLPHSGGSSPSTSACRPSTARRRPAIATSASLKSAGTISAILRADPSLADWWIRMEEEARPASPLAAVFARTGRAIAGCGTPSSPSRPSTSEKGTHWPIAFAMNDCPATFGPADEPAHTEPPVFSFPDPPAGQNHPAKPRPGPRQRTTQGQRQMGLLTQPRPEKR